MHFQVSFDTNQQPTKLLRRFLLVLPLVLLVLILWFLGSQILSVLSPFFVAGILAYLLDPLVNLISGQHRQAFRLHRALSIVIVFLIFFLLIGGLLAYLIPTIFRESSDFARSIRHSYLPAISREIQPRLEEWFAERNMLRNGRFQDWNQEKPDHWMVPTDIRVAPLSDQTDGLTITHLSDNTWFLRQQLSNIITDGTYTLLVESGPLQPNVDLIYRLYTNGQNTSTLISEATFTLDQSYRQTLYFSSDIGPATLELSLAHIQDVTTVSFSSILMIKPPPLPFFQASFWKDWYQRNRSVFSWNNISRILAYGYRGAGAVAQGAGGLWFWLAGTLGGIVSLGLYVLLVMVILFYTLLELESIKAWILSLVPDKARPRFLSIVHEIDSQLSGFIRGQAIVCLCVGVCVCTMLILSGVRFGFLIGICAGAFNFIPYLGPALGMVPALFLTFLEIFDPGQTFNWVMTKIGLLLFGFLFIQALDGMVISPRVVGKNVEVSPLVIMAVLMLGGGIAGLLGMILSIPVYCIIRVLVSEYWKELSASNKPA